MGDRHTSFDYISTHILSDLRICYYHELQFGDNVQLQLGNDTKENGISRDVGDTTALVEMQFIPTPAITLSGFITGTPVPISIAICRFALGYNSIRGCLLYVRKQIGPNGLRVFVIFFLEAESACNSAAF